MRKTILFLLLLFNLQIFAKELELNTKFGKPTQEELTMTTYAPDPEAAAVVLYSETDVSYQYVNDLKLVTTVKVRLKILKEEGKDMVNIEVPYVESTTNRVYGEVISGLKATTYNLENGKLQKTKMGNELVFRERLDKNTMLLKFTFPQLKVGSVVEYQYNVDSYYYWDIDTWYAQGTLPVAYTKYTVSIPEWFTFNLEETGVSGDKMTRSKSAENRSFLIDSETISCLEYKNVFIGRDIPAIKGDSYVWNTHDYVNKVTCELASIFIPGSMVKNYTQTWEKISENLLNDDDFGEYLNKSNPLKGEMTSDEIKKAVTIEEKVEAVWHLLNKHVKWNGKYGIWGHSFQSVLKNGTGSNADLNFIMMSMLKSLGVKTYPVVLSTRTHGRLPITHPSQKSLNTFIMGIEKNDSTMLFFDSSARYGYLNVLPSQLLVDRARVLKSKDAGYWVDLQNISQGKVTYSVKATLTADGVLKGVAASQYTGNAVIDKRAGMKEAKDSATYTNDYAREHKLEISKLSTKGRFAFSPQMTQQIEFSQQCAVTDELIYFSPILFPAYETSPFVDETRFVPIEFPYKETYIVSENILLPDGYEIDVLPNGGKMTAEDGTVSWEVKAAPTGNMLMVLYKLNIKKPVFSQIEYLGLKKLLDSLVEKNQMMIVLKKCQ